MRRKPGTLVPLEREILEAAVALRAMGVAEAHGFLLARTMDQATDETNGRRLTAYGTLYKALDRLERAGHLTSRWEDPVYAADAARPRRRFYRLTPAADAARPRRRFYRLTPAADAALAGARATDRQPDAAPDRGVPAERPVS